MEHDRVMQIYVVLDGNAGLRNGQIRGDAAFGRPYVADLHLHLGLLHELVKLGA